MVPVDGSRASRRRAVVRLNEIDSGLPEPHHLRTLSLSGAVCHGTDGLVAPRLDVLPALRFTAALAAGGYALFQILIYQLNLFTPGLPEGKAPLWIDVNLEVVLRR